MILYTQTNTTADRDWLAKGLVPGNCLQTAVASWLDLPLKDVPHFAADERPGPGWWTAMRTWARETLGQDFTWAAPDAESIPALRAEILKHNLWDGLVIAGGPTVRGSEHVVLVHIMDLSLAWDPHPSRAGLVNITDLTWLCGTYDPDPEAQYAEWVAAEAAS